MKRETRPDRRSSHPERRSDGPTHCEDLLGSRISERFEVKTGTFHLRYSHLFIRLLYTGVSSQDSEFILLRVFQESYRRIHIIQKGLPILNNDKNNYL